MPPTPPSPPWKLTKSKSLSPGKRRARPKSLTPTSRSQTPPTGLPLKLRVKIPKLTRSQSEEDLREATKTNGLKNRELLRHIPVPLAPEPPKLTYPPATSATSTRDMPISSPKMAARFDKKLMPPPPPPPPRTRKTCPSSTPNYSAMTTTSVMPALQALTDAVELARAQMTPSTPSVSPISSPEVLEINPQPRVPQHPEVEQHQQLAQPQQRLQLVQEVHQHQVQPSPEHLQRLQLPQQPHLQLLEHPLIQGAMDTPIRPKQRPSQLALSETPTPSPAPFFGGFGVPRKTIRVQQIQAQIQADIIQRNIRNNAQMILQSSTTSTPVPAPVIKMPEMPANTLHLPQPPPTTPITPDIEQDLQITSEVQHRVLRDCIHEETRNRDRVIQEIQRLHIRHPLYKKQSDRVRIMSEIRRMEALREGLSVPYSSQAHWKRLLQPYGQEVTRWLPVGTTLANLEMLINLGASTPELDLQQMIQQRDAAIAARNIAIQSMKDHIMKLCTHQSQLGSTIHSMLKVQETFATSLNGLKRSWSDMLHHESTLNKAESKAYYGIRSKDIGEVITKSVHAQLDQMLDDRQATRYASTTNTATSTTASTSTKPPTTDPDYHF